MLIDAIVKVVFFLWFMIFSGYVGYCIGLAGLNKQFWKEFFNTEFLNDEEEEEDDEFQ